MSRSGGKRGGEQKRKRDTEQINPKNFRYKRLKGNVRKKIETELEQEKEGGERHTEIQGNLRE